MKRLIALTLAFCMVIVCISCAGAEATTKTILPVRLTPALDTALTDQEALDKALSLMTQQHPQLSTDPSTTVCHVNAAAMSDGSPVVVASVFCQGDWPMLYAVVTLNADTGAVLRYEETDEGWFSEVQAQWESVYGAYGRWPLELQELYDVLYCVEVNHATLPDNCVTEEQAFRLAITAAGLTANADTLTYERSLALNAYADTESERLVWFITLMQNGYEVAQVDLSAYDGHVVDVFMNESDLG